MPANLKRTLAWMAGSLISSASCGDTCSNIVVEFHKDTFVFKKSQANFSEDVIAERHFGCSHRMFEKQEHLFVSPCPPKVLDLSGAFISISLSLPRSVYVTVARL